jgi:hypothetical protein
MEVTGLIHGRDIGHQSEYGGRNDEDVAPRELDAAALKKKLRDNFEEAKFETGKLRIHYLNSPLYKKIKVSMIALYVLHNTISNFSFLK